MRVAINVTQEDIDLGQTSNNYRSQFCPLSRAVRRVFPDLHSIRSTGRLAFIDGAYIPSEIHIPDNARAFMNKADFNAAVQWSESPSVGWKDGLEPFSFELELPVS